MKTLLSVLLENPRMSLLAVVFLIMLGVVGIMKGCGGPKPRVNRTVQTKQPVKMPQKGRPAPPPVRPPANDDDDNPKPQPKPQPQPKPDEKKAVNDKKPTDDKKKKERPADLAAWTPEDFLNARQEGDKRLVEAIEFSEHRDASREKAAAALAKLLDAPPADPKADPNKKNAAPKNNAKMIEAVISALFANGTPAARTVVAQAAGGKIATMAASDRVTASEIAVKALLAHDEPWCENALFDIAVNPGEADALEDAAIRKTTMAAIRESASASLRRRIAESMTSLDMRKSLYEELWTCLADAKPENNGPQIALYQERRMNPAARETLESRWLIESGEQWQRLLRRVGDVKSDDAGSQLWRPSLASAIERRMAVLETWNAGGRDLNAVLLAATIPNAELRAAVFRLLKRHWDDGPAALEAAMKAVGEPAAGVRRTAARPSVETGNVPPPVVFLPEPGFELVVKSLPRKDAPSGAAIVQPKLNKPRPAAVPRTRVEDETEARRLHEELAQQWMRFSESVMRAQLARFGAAADATADIGAPPDKMAADWTDVPHPTKSAQTLAAYCLNVLKADGKPVAGMPRVWYWRAEQRGTPLRTLSYYARQVPNGVQRLRSDSAWIDSLETFAASNDSAKKNIVRSIDLVISRPSKAFAGLADQEQRLVVEALVIECDAPAQK